MGKTKRIYVKLSALWGNGDAGGSIKVSRRRWKAIQEGAEYYETGSSYYEGERYSVSWDFAGGKVTINGDDGAQHVVEMGVEELYVELVGGRL